MINKKNFAPFIIIIAAILWGIIGLFTRALVQLNFSLFQIAFSRALITFLGSGIIILITGVKSFKIKLKDLWLFLANGFVSIVLFNVLYFYTIDNTTLSIAAILLYTSPFFVMILAYFIFKEKITKKMVLALILAIIGCFLTTGIIGSHISLNPEFIFTGILAGFFYSLYSIFSTIILKKYSPITLIFYTFLFATIGLFPLANPAVYITKINLISTVFILLIGVVSTLIPFFLYTLGLKSMEASKASIISFIEPLTATLLGIVVFHEQLTVQNVTGIILIFVAMLILNLRIKKKTNFNDLHKNSLFTNLTK